MRKRLLVVTSVHPADDPRIRYKHIGSLERDFDILYATKAPGPIDPGDLEWHELSGGRVRRWFTALRLMRTADVDLIAIHDPELIPAAVVTAAVRSVPVVFDVHEDLPAQIRARHSYPAILRRPLASFARMWIKVAERRLDVTLAEAGYQDQFESEKPVFPNYPVARDLPAVAEDRGHGVVYVGDVTIQRGALTLLDAVARAEIGPLVYVGRCDPGLRRSLLEHAALSGIDIDVRGWLPHGEAMVTVRSAAVGVSPLHDTPNYRYSLPTKTLEYLAMGVPVIATDLPGTRSAIADLRGVRLVAPEDVDSLAEALRADMSDLAADARSDAERVRQSYRWPDDEVRTFYASLLSA